MEFLSHRYHRSASNIWVTLNALIEEHCEINLGQGMPDYAPDSYVQRTLAEVAMEENKFLQYTRGQGHPRLVAAIADLYSTKFGRELNSQTEVLVTHGANGSIISSFLGLVNEADEVILVEPCYNAYLPNIYAAGAIPIFVPMRLSSSQIGSSADWKLDVEELESKITSKTRFIVIVNPNNPLGKVFNRQELLDIANVCVKYNLICFSDEVYEWLAFDDEHVYMASLPGMWERTVSIFSAGKSFSVTGWRIGWSIGPTHLISCVMVAHSNGVAAVNTPCQEAIARCLEKEIQRIDKPDSFFTVQRQQLQAKRDKLVTVLRKFSFKVYVPQGGYFIVADWSAFAVKYNISLEDGDLPKDMKFANWLITKLKIGSIPIFSFFPGSCGFSDNLIRFCFFKADSVLAKLEGILYNQLKETG